MKTSRMAVLVLASLAAYVVSVQAEDAKAKRPTGTWEKKIGDNQIQLDIKEGSVRITVTTAEATIAVDADYGITKDGTIYGIITKVEKKGTCEGPTEGDLFSFKYSLQNDVLNLKDLKGSRDSEEAKQLIEGEYKSKS
jgi:hypothetical protein